MLEILSQTRDPTKVQKHINKCFEGISRLFFNDKQIIDAMISHDLEIVLFKEGIEPSCSVEAWLTQVEYQMKLSIKEYIIQSRNKWDINNINTWLFDWPTQVVLVVKQIIFTFELEEALYKNG